MVRSRINGMTAEERRHLTEIFFGVLESTGAKTLTELNQGAIRNGISILRTINDMDRETKDMALYLIGKLFEIKPLEETYRKGSERVRVEFGWTPGRDKKQS